MEGRNAFPRIDLRMSKNEDSLESRLQGDLGLEKARCPLFYSFKKDICNRSTANAYWPH